MASTGSVAAQRTIVTRRTLRRASRLPPLPALIIPSARNSFLVEFQGKLQVARLVARERHRVNAGVARAAVRVSIRTDGRHQAFQAQISDTVGIEIAGDLVERVRGGDELGPLWGVDAVEAR